MLNNTAVYNLLTRVCSMEASGAKAVKTAYVQLNEYLNRPPLQPHQIQAYARDLEDYPAHVVVRALEEMRRQPGRRFLPLPWEVVEFMAPQRNDDNHAAEIAASIVACISSCGRTNAALAERRLGVLGWAVVAQLGGWEQLCCTLRNDEVNTFRAQARGVAKAELEKVAQSARVALLQGRIPSLRGEQESLALSKNEQVSQLIGDLANRKAQGVL